MTLSKKIRITLFSFGSFFIPGYLAQSVLDVGQVCNEGAGFGIGNGWFAGVGVALLGLITFFMLKHEYSWRIFVGLGMLYAGAMLNILDRIHYGCIWDQFSFVGFFWFNIADIYVMLGAVLLIVNLHKEQ